MDKKFKKDDEDKVKYHLLDPDFLEELAKVLGFGAKKYGENNYNLGTDQDFKRLYSALMRHLEAWRKKEKIDHETGYHHLIAVAANAMILYKLDQTNP